MISRTEMNLDSYIRKDNFLEAVDMQHLTPLFLLPFRREGRSPIFNAVLH